jgi:branched-chain amino acid transport system permease protein
MLGVVVERIFLRPFRGDVEGTIITTIALILILQTVVVGIAGVSYKDIPSPVHGIVDILGLRLSWERLLAILVSIGLVFALFFFISKTKNGQAMLAVSQNREAASLMGIDVDRVCSLAMFVGCGLAAAAGGLTGAIFDIHPYIGEFALMKGIEVVILGGLGSIGGAVTGGLILGLVDGLVTPLLSAQIAGMIELSLIMAILLLRPTGLFGHA